MVFVNTKVAAEKVARRSSARASRSAMLSGDVPQKKRQSLLGKFQRGEIEILVATDVAARGLHIPDVSHVFNYDLPHDAEDYVHRIGRTARLGAEGDAISFACDLYAQGLPDIEAYIEQKIPVERIEAPMLVAPPRRARAAAAGATEDETADDARNTAGPPPTAAKSSRDRPRAPRSDRERRRPDKAEKTRAEAAPAVVGQAVVAPAVVVPAVVAPAKPAVAASGSPAATDPERRKRRRRGGRGRGRREGGEAGTQTAIGGENRVQAKPKNDASRERKPARERPAREGAEPRAPIATKPPVVADRGKPGLFQRIARFFTPR